MDWEKNFILPRALYSDFLKKLRGQIVSRTIQFQYGQRTWTDFSREIDISLAIPYKVKSAVTQRNRNLFTREWYTNSWQFFYKTPNCRWMDEQIMVYAFIQWNTTHQWQQKTKYWCHIWIGDQKANQPLPRAKGTRNTGVVCAVVVFFILIMVV